MADLSLFKTLTLWLAFGEQMHVLLERLPSVRHGASFWRYKVK